MKPARHNLVWCPRENWFIHMNPEKGPDEIAAHLGRSREAVMTRARQLGVKLTFIRHAYKDKTPPKFVWVAAAATAAREADVPLVGVLAGVRRRPFVRARVAAWKALLESGSGYSVAGLARVSGFNHTTILHNLGKLKERTHAQSLSAL